MSLIFKPISNKSGYSYQNDNEDQNSIDSIQSTDY